MPRQDTVTIDDWFPTGMRGTGSRSMAVDDVFVPDHRVHGTRDTVFRLQERRALHPTFDAMYAPWPSYGRFTFAATAVGAAWGGRALRGAARATMTRVANALGGAVRLADQDYVATEFAEAAGEVQMAGARSSGAASRPPSWRGDTSPPDGRRWPGQHRDNALVTRVALREVQRIHALVGAKAGFPSTRLAGEARRRDGRRPRHAQLAPGRRPLPGRRRIEGRPRCTPRLRPISRRDVPGDGLVPRVAPFHALAWTRTTRRHSLTGPAQLEKFGLSWPTSVSFVRGVFGPPCLQRASIANTAPTSGRTRKARPGALAKRRPAGPARTRAFTSLNTHYPRDCASSARSCL